MTKYIISISNFEDLGSDAQRFANDTYPSRNGNWLFYQTGRRIILKRDSEGNIPSELLFKETLQVKPDFSGQFATITTALEGNIEALADTQELAKFLKVKDYEDIL